MAISPQGRIVISNPQSYVKDVYASAPSIDLTVRANGEEKVMVMDSLGNFNIAGIESPTVAPTITLGSGTPFTAATFWAYQYVYVAKQAYPLVENAITGGGSPAPRSNPSPVSAVQDGTASRANRIISCPTSSRGDITNIWIYRTNFFLSSDEALTNAQAGNLSWIGEILNAQDSSSISFTDNLSVVFGADEQIENDNFLCPIFDKVIFVDPYFWGFGNSLLTIPVTVNSSGVITATTGNWFNGRDGETITFAGITTGGFDNHGTYFFKTIDNTNAQLYSDLALTQLVGLSTNGTTTAYIKGDSTTLYRSKPRNPFSWGETLLIGDEQVPLLYTFPIGGGTGTAISVIPNQNLLKLDTEGPNYCYTLNLKNAGTPDFESSLRVIADNYSISNQHAQFSATLENGQNVLWGIDTKSFAIVQCDGTEQRPISSMVYKTLRTMSLDNGDRLFFHGFYCPRLELNCILIKTYDGGFQNINLLVYQHAPTGEWGTIDMFDILCSSSIFDSNSGQEKIIVGTQTGLVGEMFAEGRFHNWFENENLNIDGFLNIGSGQCAVNATPNQITPFGSFFNFKYNPGGGAIPIPGVIGNWVTIISQDTQSKYFCRISSLNTAGTSLNFDLVFALNANNPPISTIFPGVTNGAQWYLGLIELEIGRSFNGAIPFDYKKAEEFWSTWKYVSSTVPTLTKLYEPTIEWFNGFIEQYPTGIDETSLLSTELTVPPPSFSRAFIDGVQTNIPVDEAKTFGIIIRDKNYCEAQLVNYELRLSKLDGNFPETTQQRYPS